MKILEIKKMALPEIKVIRFERFSDTRGYFTETLSQDELSFDLKQSNESFSKKNVLRGLHFQSAPAVAKMVRVIRGHMIDFALDIRPTSPTRGKIVAYEMASTETDTFGEWIHIPAGFAHGNLFLEDTLIEYFCSNQHNSASEGGVDLFSPDIDWSLVEPRMRPDKEKRSGYIMSKRDSYGH